MNARVEPISLKSLAPMPESVWRTLCFFSNNQLDDGSKYLEGVLTEQEKVVSAWMVGFDFCRLTSKHDTLSKLTEKYALVFNRPPPDWILTPVSQPAAAQSKGVQLNVLSVSGPESESYQNSFTSSQEKKAALLIKLSPQRQLSWQEIAVQRLARGIEQLRKAKIPVYIENPEVFLSHIKKIAFDRRTDADWSILFYFLLYTEKEALFEEEALQYTLVKGMSPPSFEKLNYSPIKNWFETSVQSVDEDNGTIVLNGILSNHIGLLTQRVMKRLQTQGSVVLDLRGISHADWASVFDIAALHQKIWDTGSRKIYIIRPSALLAKMFECAGIPDKSYMTPK